MVATFLKPSAQLGSKDWLTNPSQQKAQSTFLEPGGLGDGAWLHKQNAKNGNRYSPSSFPGRNPGEPKTGAQSRAIATNAQPQDATGSHKIQPSHLPSKQISSKNDCERSGCDTGLANEPHQPHSLHAQNRESSPLTATSASVEAGPGNVVASMSQRHVPPHLRVRQEKLSSPQHSRQMSGGVAVAQKDQPEHLRINGTQSPKSSSTVSKSPVSPEGFERFKQQYVLSPNSDTTKRSNASTGGDPKLREEPFASICQPKAAATPDDTYASRLKLGAGIVNGVHGGYQKHNTGPRNSRTPRPNLTPQERKAMRPAPEPKRWQFTWYDEDGELPQDKNASPSGSFDSLKKKTSPGFDSETGFQLTDWTGNWAPAPIEWDSRPAFRDHQSEAKIFEWLKATDDTSKGRLAITLDGSEGMIVPRAWIPTKFGSWTPQYTWAAIMKSTTPKPQDDDDLDGVRPWWESYPPNGALLPDPAAPLIIGIDPTQESEHERLAREADLGSTQHTENRRRLETSKQSLKAKKKQAREENAKRIAEVAPQQPSDKIQTDLNLYVRTAQESDAWRLKEIYNYYINFSTCVPENDTRTEEEMLERLRDVQRNDLPFIVVCERGHKIPGNKKKNKDPIQLPDKIVGFAFADDMNDMRSMYRFTVELEFYVDNTLYMKGIGKVLVDKMMTLLDPNYLEKGGYDIESPELEANGTGTQRYIKNVIIHFPYDKPERLEWMTRWLTGWIGFNAAGRLEDIGIKCGKSVHLATFQRKTGVTIDPANAPGLMNYPTA